MQQPTQTFHRFTASEIRGIFLVLLGVATVSYYLEWWFHNGRLSSPALLIGFLIATAYILIQLLGNWSLYLATHWRTRFLLPAMPDLSVDVYITAYDEDHSLIERCLRAAVNMRGQHKTWLLDDGDDPALEKMAARLGAGYLTRQGSKDAKAGNLNAAMPRTTGDIIVIFDIDHAPQPHFLERTLPYFANPEIGFVQVMLTFENDDEGWVAQSAGDSSLDFYNPTSIGADGLGSATLIGSNALIRRTALEQIGGYKPGLAEDLATSLALHAANWRSIYVPEPLAPGLAPPDLGAWFTQQLKWARGVFELFVAEFPRVFWRLSGGQRISYAVRMTYYWIGLFVGLHLLITVGVLWQFSDPVYQAYENYLLRLFPMLGMTVLIRTLALRRWRHRMLPSKLAVGPMFLVYGTWPIYMLAWLMAILRIPLRFRPTPKAGGNQLPIHWIIPQLLIFSLLVLGGSRLIAMESSGFYPLILLFALGQAGALFVLLLQWLRDRIQTEIVWDKPTVRWQNQGAQKYGNPNR